MDLNHLLTWLVGTSAAFALFVITRRHGRRFMGWVGVQVFVLLVLGFGLWRMPDSAGFLGLAVWLPLVLIPNLANRLLNRLVRQSRFRAARGVSVLMSLLHPFDGWRQIPQLLQAFEFRSRGDSEQARTILASLAKGPSASARQAYFQLLGMDQKWDETRQWIEAHLHDPTFSRDTATLSTYLRALGEVGDYEAMVDSYRVLVRPLMGRANPRWVASMRLLLAAFLGQADLVRTLLKGPLNHLPMSTQTYWLATALQTLGHTEQARQQLQMLEADPERLLSSAAQQRIARPLPQALEIQSAPQAQALLADISASNEDFVTYGSLSQPPAGNRHKITMALVLANLAVFALELPQGSENPENLFNLGALVAPAIYLQGEWWRIISALFLHFGPLHLSMNMLALWYFGRYLERLLGALRFSLLYGIAAPGSMLLILGAATWVDAPFHIVVGASGGVMALLGAILAVMWQRWRVYGAHMAKRDAWLLIIMLALQTLFDLTTPEVSFLGHFSGTVLGFVLGLLLARKSPTTLAAAQNTGAD